MTYFSLPIKCSIRNRQDILDKIEMRNWQKVIIKALKAFHHLLYNYKNDWKMIPNL